MKQIIQSYKTGKIELLNVPAPLAKAGGLVVHTRRSLISIGTERLMIDTAKKSLAGKAMARPDLVKRALDKARKEGFLSVYKEAMGRLDEPVPLGYSSSGEVIGVGSGVTGFNIGDRVACAGSGFASHAEVVWVPKNLCVRIPDGVDFDAAAFSMVGGIALHGVRSAHIEPGETVAVIGLGLLGLLTAQILEAYSVRVIGMDVDSRKVELAKKLGMSQGFVIGKDDIGESVLQDTGNRGVDACIVTASSRDRGPIEMAEGISRKRGRVVLVGVTDLTLDRKSFWEKELIFTVSKAAGPGSLDENYEVRGHDYPKELVRWTEKRNLEHYLDLVRKKKIQISPLVTHRFKFSDALSAYDQIVAGKEAFIGVLFEYEDGPAAQGLKSSRVCLADRVARSDAAHSVGVIGGGPFAKNVLLPALARVKKVQLKAIATTRGVGSQHLAHKFGFGYCTTDYTKILSDSGIDSVLILTRHDQHASLVLEALESGKNVFVEKPLCLTEAELSKIANLVTQMGPNGPRLQVGFNRTSSPAAHWLKNEVKNRQQPFVMNYRVNAGFIPAEHWVHDEKSGGGRIIGEVCHFIDLLAFFADADPVSVYTRGILGAGGKYSRQDNVILSVCFADGSVGTISYASQGSKSFSRERVEVFSGENVIMLEDFRMASAIRGPKRVQKKWASQQMGYREELEVFLKPSGSRTEHSFRRTAVVTLASIRALESLRTGLPLVVEFGEGGAIQ